MQLTTWTYEGPPHVGAMRVATAMTGVHYVLHAPQGDTYADLLFTMIERRDKRPPVTYTTFQARDLGADTAELFKAAARDAYRRFEPELLLVGSSCTAELLQDDTGGLARACGLPVPVVPLELPAYQKKENWGAAETFYRLVRACAARSETAPRPQAGELARLAEGESDRLTRGETAIRASGRASPDPARSDRLRSRGGRAASSCNVLGPTALGFRHRDDLEEVARLLAAIGITVNVTAPWGASPSDLARLGDASFNVALYPEIAGPTAVWLERTFGQPCTKTVPIGEAATRAFVREVAGLAGLDPDEALARAEAASPSRLPWWSASVDSNYLTGKRCFVFGDAAHALAVARVAAFELGFEVVSVGTFERAFAKEVRALAGELGCPALITDDHLEVEDAIKEAAPELVLGTQCERHAAKRLGLPCAVISAPVHVQDFPARRSPFMGFEGANVLFDTMVHPLTMGLEEHLLAMFRDDFEFAEAAGASHLASEAPQGHRLQEEAPATAPAAEPGAWTPEALAELKKVPFFVRGKAKRNTEAFALERGLSPIGIETLYDAKAHHAR